MARAPLDLDGELRFSGCHWKVTSCASALQFKFKDTPNRNLKSQDADASGVLPHHSQKTGCPHYAWVRKNQAAPTTPKHVMKDVDQRQSVKIRGD